jgi:rhamnose utilization protein RhaD (predicted bifunctional aldolase and dehydrogenase)
MEIRLPDNVIRLKILCEDYEDDAKERLKKYKKKHYEQNKEMYKKYYEQHKDRMKMIFNKQ